MRVAFFAGTFDPITTGHVDIVSRALSVFDRVVVGIGVNAAKTTLFSLAERKEMLRSVFSRYNQVSIVDYQGLTVSAAIQHSCTHLLRGIRTIADFEYEKSICELNHHQNPQIETVFLLSTHQFGFISSTHVRDLIRHGGNIFGLIPDEVLPYLKPVNP